MKSWTRLTQSARDTSPPRDIDLRAAIRAEITAHPVPATQATAPGLIDDLASLISAPWFLAGTTALAVIAYVSCQDGLDVINELALVWHLQGPVMSGI